MVDTVTLNVYFQGTNHRINKDSATERTCQQSVVGRAFIDDVIAELSANDQNDQNVKKNFDGCGVINPVLGTMFGVGLEAQCHEIVAFVRKTLAQGRRIKLNVMGLSRGGVAALMLARMLGEIDPLLLETNLFLLDPVPGNMVLTQQLDFLRFSLAAQNMELTRVRNLRRVVALYPKDPLVWTATDPRHMNRHLFPWLFAPLLPTYPENTALAEKIIDGAHLTKFYHRDEDLDNNNYKVLQPVKQWCFDAGQGAQAPNFDHQYFKLEDGSETGDAFSKPTHGRCRVQRNGQVTAKSAFNLEKERISTLLDNISSSNAEKNAKIGQLKARVNALQDQNVEQLQLHSILLQILLLTLQRTANPYSFFNTTSSGWMLVKQLNENSEFAAIKQCILNDNNTETRVRYRDLRKFAVGSNDVAFFSAGNRKQNDEALVIAAPAV